MSHYIAYYDAQVGGGIEHVFVGSPHQRGYGVGSFLAGLFRKALPLIKRGARAVGKEALRAGMNIMDDLSNDVPFTQSFKVRARESRDSLKRKAEEKLDRMMSGSGYKRPRMKRKKQLKRVGTGRRTSRKNKKRKTASKRVKKPKKKKVKKNKRSVTDIFGPLY